MRDFQPGTVAILAEHVAELQAGLRGCGIPDRNSVVLLVGKQRLVRMAEEGDHLVVADDHHILQGIYCPVAVDDVLDGISDQVFSKGALIVRVGLAVGEGDRVIRTDVDNHARYFWSGSEAVQLGLQGTLVRRAPSQAGEVGQDDRAIVPIHRIEAGGRQASIHRSTVSRKQFHFQVERIGWIESTTAATHTHVKIACVIPGINADPFTGDALESRNSNHAARLRAGEGIWAEHIWAKIIWAEVIRREIIRAEVIRREVVRAEDIRREVVRAEDIRREVVRAENVRRELSTQAHQVLF